MSEEYIEIPQITAQTEPLQEQGQNEDQPNPSGGETINNNQEVVTPKVGEAQYVYAPDPMQELISCKNVYIKQEPASLFVSCESQNRFLVFAESVEGGAKLLFKCKENSGCCMRTFCTANNRSFNMSVKHITTSADLDENFSKTFVDILKPFKCTCFCLARPEMVVTFGEGDKQCLGIIREPFSCCDPVFAIYDEKGELKYNIHADCCQCGLIFNNTCCGKLSEVLFNIFELSNPVGSIVKKRATSNELFSTADSYQINFPSEATPTDKMLLIAAGLMIDYQYFEDLPSKNDG